MTGDVQQQQAVEQLVVPKNYTAARAGACRVEPDGDADSYVVLLAAAGAIGSNNNFKESSQVPCQHPTGLSLKQSTSALTISGLKAVLVSCSCGQYYGMQLSGTALSVTLL